MIINSTDIKASWTEEDIALFAGAVEAVTHACDATLAKYGRLEDPVLFIICKAALTAAKSMVLTAGLRDHGTSATALEAFNAMLKLEIEESDGLAKKIDAHFTPKRRH